MNSTNAKADIILRFYHLLFVQCEWDGGRIRKPPLSLALILDYLRDFFFKKLFFPLNGYEQAGIYEKEVKSTSY